MAMVSSLLILLLMVCIASAQYIGSDIVEIRRRVGQNDQLFVKGGCSPFNQSAKEAEANCHGCLRECSRDEIAVVGVSNTSGCVLASIFRARYMLWYSFESSSDTYHIPTYNFDNISKDKITFILESSAHPSTTSGFTNCSIPDVICPVEFFKGGSWSCLDPNCFSIAQMSDEYRITHLCSPTQRNQLSGKIIRMALACHSESYASVVTSRYLVFKLQGDVKLHTCTALVSAPLVNNGTAEPKIVKYTVVALIIFILFLIILMFLCWVHYGKKNQYATKPRPGGRRVQGANNEIVIVHPEHIQKNNGSVVYAEVNKARSLPREETNNNNNDWKDYDVVGSTIPGATRKMGKNPAPPIPKQYAKILASVPEAKDDSIQGSVSSEYADAAKSVFSENVQLANIGESDSTSGYPDTFNKPEGKKPEISKQKPDGKKPPETKQKPPRPKKPPKPSLYRNGLPPPDYPMGNTETESFPPPPPQLVLPPVVPKKDAVTPHYIKNVLDKQTKRKPSDNNGPIVRQPNATIIRQPSGEENIALDRVDRL